MPNFNWEVNTYSYSQNREVTMRLNDVDLQYVGVMDLKGAVPASQIVRIWFTTQNDQRALPANFVAGPTVNIIMNASQSDRILDVLRNERPVYFRGNTDNAVTLSQVAIATGDELTGEGE